MNEIKITSTLKKIKEISWNDTIQVDKIMIDQTLFESHKSRIEKVFANAPQEVKENQLQNILMRDTLFNKAMDKIVKCFEFDIKQEDIEAFSKLIAVNIPKNNTIPEADMKARIQQIAEKLIQKELIFNDIAATFNITVDAKETMEILDEYNKSTGNPIDDITSDKTKLTGAVNALLEEKITAFIINKFDKDFSELQKNIQLDAEATQKSDTAKAATSGTDAGTASVPPPPPIDKSKK